MVEQLVDVFEFHQVNEIFPGQQQRYKDLSRSFTGKYGYTPDFFVRAPGRVNIIGEHIDYHGYGVLPMALSDRDIVAAVSFNKNNKIEIQNMEEKFTSKISGLDLKIDEKHEWYNYVLAGFKGVVEKTTAVPVGLNLLFHGTIPQGAGVSSSSALVCCSAITAACAYKVDISKSDLANLCADSEKYVGTRGGGMDQAASILSEANCAQFIEFNPLKTTKITLPLDSRFLVANSMVEALKAKEESKYNVRVAEGKIGAQIIAKLLGLEVSRVNTLKSLQQILGKTLSEIIEIAEQKLEDKCYTYEMALQILGDNSILEEYKKFIPPCGMFCRKRILHVYSEAKRVENFVAVCQDSSKSDTSKIEELGELMNASQNSCAIDYECSCPELDTLTKQLNSFGCKGSRLTGAGWGGCTVSICSATIAKNLKREICQNYYNGIEDDAKVFITSPGRGACIFVISKHEVI